MKKFIIIIVILIGLVGCSNGEENEVRVESLVNENEATTNQIEEKNSEIAKLTEELAEEKKNVEELQETLEDSNHPYYVNEDPEVRSEDGERLGSYAFIIEGIANRISHIDGLMEDGQYNDKQLDMLKIEREFVWQLWLDWKDKQAGLMEEVELLE